MVQTASSERLYRVASVCGMASLFWALLLNNRFFPVAMANEFSNAAVLLSLYVLFGVVLIAACVCAFYCAHRKPGLLRAYVCVCGVVGAAGLVLISAFEASAAAAGIGACLIAFYMSAYVLYWTLLFRARGGCRSAIVDAALSIVVLCVFSAAYVMVGIDVGVVFGLVPLLSCACAMYTWPWFSKLNGRAHVGAAELEDAIEVVEAVEAAEAAGAAGAAGTAGAAGAAANEEPSLALVARVLVPCVIYFYLAKAMDVGLDFVSMLSLDPYRIAVLMCSALISLVAALLLSRTSVPFVRRLTESFTVVSACLLVAMFVTCCQTMGFLPLGNYAIVTVKIMLGFFVWLLIALVPSGKGSSLAVEALLVCYFVLIFWLPNFVHNALLALAPATGIDSGLSGVFVVVSALALVTSIISSMTVSSFVSHPKVGEDDGVAAQGIASATQAAGTPGAQGVGAVGTAAAGAGVQGVGAVDVQGGETAGEVALPGFLVEFQQEYGLSDREMDVVKLTCEGKAAKRIASELFIAEGTVYTHQKNVYHKVDVHSKQELMDAVDAFKQSHSA